MAESLNPGGSIKDRSALAIITSARASGILSAGQPMVEMTSGNMGAGLALVCSLLGHPFTAVMSEGDSAARRKIIEAFRSELILVSLRLANAERVSGESA